MSFTTIHNYLCRAGTVRILTEHVGNSANQVRRHGKEDTRETMRYVSKNKLAEARLQNEDMQQEAVEVGKHLTTLFKLNGSAILFRSL